MSNIDDLKAELEVLNNRIIKLQRQMDLNNSVSDSTTFKLLDMMNKAHDLSERIKKL